MNIMKKMMSILLALMMLVPAAALGEQDEMIAPIVGKIAEAREDGSFIVDQLNAEGQVHVLVPETLGYAAEWTLGVGDVVLVTYDGRMTRSMPPQVTAEAISSHVLFGAVEEANAEYSRLLVNSAEMGQVWVNLPEGLAAEEYVEKTVRVYFNGVVALSLPGQLTALTIETVEAMSGMLLSISDETDEDAGGHFLFDTETGEVRVNFDDHTKIIHSFDEGDSLTVFFNGIMTRSLPGQIYAMAVAKTAQ